MNRFKKSSLVAIYLVLTLIAMVLAPNSALSENSQDTLTKAVATSIVETYKNLQNKFYGDWKGKESQNGNEFSGWWTYNDPNGRWSIELPSGWEYAAREVDSTATTTTFENESALIFMGVGDFQPLGSIPVSAESLVNEMLPYLIDTLETSGFSNVYQLGDITPITTYEGDTGYEVTLRGSYLSVDFDARIALFKNDKDEVFALIFVYETGNPYIGDNTEIIKRFKLATPGQPSGYPSGYEVNDDLRIGAIIHTVEKGEIEAIWHEGGREYTARGDMVIWGYFYASPYDVTWGSKDNPDLYVKIWYDCSGRIDVNFFFVSVPDISVYSDYLNDGSYDNQGTTTLSNRYIRHEYWR